VPNFGQVWNVCGRSFALGPCELFHPHAKTSRGRFYIQERTLSVLCGAGSLNLIAGDRKLLLTAAAAELRLCIMHVRRTPYNSHSLTHGSGRAHTDMQPERNNYYIQTCGAVRESIAVEALEAAATQYSMRLWCLGQCNIIVVCFSLKSCIEKRNFVKLVGKEVVPDLDDFNLYHPDTLV
jgi:hypothetical protein